MPNIKSAIKRVETTKRKSAERLTKKSALKTTLKKHKEEPSNSVESLKTAIKALDKAAASNLIHKNAAARKVSRLTKAFNAAKQKD
ncbi:MAG: 30S ribosomal protein S20 [Bacillota bacterium]